MLLNDIAPRTVIQEQRPSLVTHQCNATPTPYRIEGTTHRCHLPADCIAFSSEKGRKLFVDAIRAPLNYMHIYFPLAEQYATQTEPEYCGLTTLAMCLNALNVDPGRYWRAPWRWYSEEIFAQWLSLTDAKERGICLNEFIFLAKCNGVAVEEHRATNKLSLTDFRDIVKHSCSTSNEVVVVNYNRQTLCQEGNGHFCPIGGYHAESDMVLLMDVARFKYPSHWVKLSLVYQAMQSLDSCCGELRGLVVLRHDVVKSGGDERPEQ